MIPILVLYETTTRCSNHEYTAGLFLAVFEGCCAFFVLRGFAELAVPVRQSDLCSAAVPSELPNWAQPGEWREKYVPGLLLISVTYITMDTFGKNQGFPDWLSVSFPFSGVEMEGYNLLVTSTIEMAVVYRSESDNFIKISVVSLGFVHSDFITVVEKMAPGWAQNSVLLCVCVCVCFYVCVCVCVFSETSRSEACLAPSASQRVTNGMQCFVLWSLTWILMGRRRCCWEHMDRSVLLFIDRLY